MGFKDILKKISRFSDSNNQEKDSIKAMDSSVASASGAGGKGDRGFSRTVQQKLYSYFELYQLYASTWEAQKMVDIPAADMTREGWEWVTTDKVADLFKKRMAVSEQKYNLNSVIFDALRKERLYGGSVILIGTSDSEDTSKPLSVENLQKGSLKFLRAIDRTRISNVTVSNDVTSVNYLNPEMFSVGGHQVHRSRLVIFDGGGVDYPGGSFGLSAGSKVWGMRHGSDGFGLSILDGAFDDILRAIAVRQSASHLVDIASILHIKAKDNALKQSTRSGNQALDKLADIADMSSMYRGVITSDKDDIVFASPSFGSVPELVITFLQVLSAGSDIPAPRFLGKAPGGLNISGQEDLHNYYDGIASQQNLKMTTPLHYLDRIIAISEGIEWPEDATLNYIPLYQESAKEAADRRAVDGGNIANLSTSGLIDDETAVKELIDKGVIENDPDFDDPDTVKQIFGYHLQAKMITINEARAERGLPPIEGGDVLMEGAPSVGDI
jgi:phage-related protein (TIGR01555 family)